MSASFDNTFGNNVALHDSAEDVDQNNFDFWLSQHDFKGCRDLLRRGTASDIEEVIGLTAEKLNRVHGRHCEAGAVDKAGDIAVELNVLKAGFMCTELCRIIFTSSG